MAPPPEYDKEPKAPDKSATNISTEDSKLLHNLINDQHTNSDHKSSNTVTAVDVENKKHVETLDDGQLKALLDEAINYKNPKDREGKSKIFKELLEEVEQESDEQACEAAARALSGVRSGRRGTRRGPALAHSNSLQDLVAALAAEPPRRHHVRATPAPPTPTVSARAIHGGSLPSGVDTSSLSEEPARGAGYLATVRCVNPPPLAERRVSASDANTPAEMELLNRRSKPMFPMTYTARATLEIGSGAVCSGRAVTTTTASNQVRTTSARQVPTDPQSKLMNALCGGRGTVTENIGDLAGKTNEPRGPTQCDSPLDHKQQTRGFKESQYKLAKGYLQRCPQSWIENVDNWYKSLPNYTETLRAIYNENFNNRHGTVLNELNKVQDHNAQNLKNIHINVSNEEKLSTKEIELKNKSIFTMKNPISFPPKLTKTKKESPIICSSNEECVETLSVDDYSKFVHNISVRKVQKYDLVVPTLFDSNPKNVRPMSVGQPQQHHLEEFRNDSTDKLERNNIDQKNNLVDINSNTVDVESMHIEEAENVLNTVHASDTVGDCNTVEDCYTVEDYKTVDDCNTVQDCDTVHDCGTVNCDCDNQKREQLNELIDMFNKLSSYTSSDGDIELQDMTSNQNKHKKDTFSKYVALQQKLITEIESLQDEITNNETCDHHSFKETEKEMHLTDLSIPTNNMNEPYSSSNTIHRESADNKQLSLIPEESDEVVNQERNVEENNIVTSDSALIADVCNDAYVLLKLPSSNNTKPFVSDTTSKPKNSKKKENLSLIPSHTNKKEDALNKNILKVILFENLFKNKSNEKSGIPGVSSITSDEVDSAISFSCITTPEVVASCNTTSSTSQSAVAVDPKPRSVISSSFNGLPLSRPNYGATSTAATDDYKKSLDENGNSVQGFSSPLSGSSQHKKPRRKKSSKNETVIDCQQIDGYQGDKDVNELLRFIESNADNGRAAKLPRVKHKDDSDDKGGKKRSAERRKDKESKLKRATSMEELSRTKIEDLTDAEAPLRTDKKERRDHAAAKERRSWGDDAREAYEPSDPGPAALELTDFQTVTKKRKPRRRADEPEREPPRRTRAPSPRRRESAPPSDRSNDSNDDLDSVHSLPGAPPPPAPVASYADIARTRHNIPDLIESCNFYAEGDGAPRRSPAAPGDADGYPALAAARRRDAKPPPAARLPRKERAEPRAPDVVADRRPPVILLDSAVRPRDMDGVTFGFDVNEQLLGGPARRPRCDLVRDAVPPALRYVAPAAPLDTSHLLQLVDYVGAAWEDVVRCGGGKVRYFSE